VLQTEDALIINKHTLTSIKLDEYDWHYHSMLLNPNSLFWNKIQLDNLI